MQKPREIILSIIILFMIPFIIFGYAVNFATIDIQSQQNTILKDEICRLNGLIGDLKDVQRACYIPSQNIIKPNHTT